MTKKIMKRSGIMNFEAFSIPCSTPLETIKTLRRMKMAWAPRANQGFEIISPKSWV